MIKVVMQSLGLLLVYLGLSALLAHFNHATALFWLGFFCWAPPVPMLMWWFRYERSRR